MTVASRPHLTRVEAVRRHQFLKRPPATESRRRDLIAVRWSSMVRAMITTVSGATARPRPSQSKGSRNSLFVRKSSFSSVVAEQVDFSQRVFSERDQALIRFLATQERKIVARIENAWLQKTKARVLRAPKPPEPPKRSALLPHEQWMPIGRQGSPRSPLQPSTPSPLNDFAHTRARPRRPSGTYDITGFGAALSAALGHDGTVTQKVVHLLVSEGVTDQVPSIQTLVPLIACALSAHVARLPRRKPEHLGQYGRDGPGDAAGGHARAGWPDVRGIVARRGCALAEEPSGDGQSECESNAELLGRLQSVRSICSSAYSWLCRACCSTCRRRRSVAGHNVALGPQRAGLAGVCRVKLRQWHEHTKRI